MAKRGKIKQKNEKSPHTSPFKNNSWTLWKSFGVGNIKHASEDELDEITKNVHKLKEGQTQRDEPVDDNDEDTDIDNDVPKEDLPVPSSSNGSSLVMDSS